MIFDGNIVTISGLRLMFALLYSALRSHARSDVFMVLMDILMRF